MMDAENLSNEAVVITGCGWVTPFAVGTISQVLEAGVTGAADTRPAKGCWTVPDQVWEKYPDFAPELKGDWGALITAMAMTHARRSAALAADFYPSERVGMALGCALAGQLGMIEFANEVREQSARFVSPLHFPQTVGNYISGALARSYGIRGPNSTLACGAASGLAAVVEGFRAIAAGRADVVFAGGTERLSPELVDGLAEPEVCFSEGACLFVLERGDRAAERGAPVLASVRRVLDLRAGEPIPRAAGEVIRSGAVHNEPGAILIEHWIGRCVGAIGAAAVAAAIGAAAGAAVPVVDSAGTGRVVVQRLAGTGGLPAIVFAGADGGSRTAVEIDLGDAVH